MSFEYPRPGCAAASVATAPLVFVVDSDADSCEILGSLILAAGWQIRTVASAEEFLLLARVTTPSCLLVELDLPGSNGLVLQRMLCNRAEVPVIFMSNQVSVPATVQAMKAGAFEFLTKPLAPNMLLEAIGGAIEHSSTALSRMAQLQSLQQRYRSLSRREREVMGLLMRGRLNKQIGGELGISEITVKAHRGKMMRKMRAGCLAELMMMAASLRCGVSPTVADCQVFDDSTDPCWQLPT